MLDAGYMVKVLGQIIEDPYRGLETDELMEKVIGKDYSEDDFLKFKYHMDELWNAGLIRQRDGASMFSWGYDEGLYCLEIIPITLVLTPVGGEFFKELLKPKGVQRMKAALRSVGATSGTEALRFTVNEVLRNGIDVAQRLG